MKELLSELKVLIASGEKEAALAKVDEIAKKADIDLPGQGNNGPIITK